MQTQEIKNEFEQILDEVMKINGLSAESATQVATVILQESGKFKRTEMISGSNRNGNDKPVTQKQIKYLQDLGILVKPGMTSKEASRLIDEARSNDRDR
jgi:hypothetical protein